jgi:polyisoprenyl-phosphate glycosyltransferase
MSSILYSIVSPVFNSETSLRELFIRTNDVFARLNYDFEMIFVDDSSTDQSWNEIEKLTKEFPGRVKGIQLSRNFGQHNATLCGINEAGGDFVITIDDDLQNPPEEISALISHQQETEAELIYGVFGKNKKHAAWRNAGSSVVKKVSKIYRKTPGDGSSFRMLNRNLANKLARHDHSFIFLDEVLLWYTDSVAFVPVRHEKRKYRQSGYSPFKMLRLTANLVFYYTNLPLKLLFYTGLSMSFIGFLMIMYFLVMKILRDVPLGYTSLIVAILFSSSVILLGIGVIGEYLSRIYNMLNKKPPYSIRRSL